MAQLGVAVRDDGRWRDVVELSRYDGIPGSNLTRAFPFLLDGPPRAVAQMRAEALYGGYLHRQQAEIRGFAEEEAVPLTNLAFDRVGGLSTELRDKLNGVRPESFGAAAGGAHSGDDPRRVRRDRRACTKKGSGLGSRTISRSRTTMS